MIERLTLHHVELKEANEFIQRLHRHHGRIQGHRFSLGATLNGKLVGVIVVGRPVGGQHQYDWTEVTRCCTDGTKNACSFLYSAAAKASADLGFFKIQTYILKSELGTSLKASGWKFDRMSHPVGWHHDGPRAARKVTDELMDQKQLWSRDLRVKQRQAQDATRKLLYDLDRTDNGSRLYDWTVAMELNMARPKGSTNKSKKTTAASVLISALDFVGCAVTEHTDVAWKGCVQFANGQVIAYNSILAAGCKVEEEFASCPQYGLLKRALEHATAGVQFTQIDSGKLAVSSGKFRAVIPCHDPLTMPDVEPNVNIAPADDRLRTGFETIGQIVKESGLTVVEASLLLTGQSMVACDRQFMIEFWHGNNLPPDLVLPKVFIQAVIAAKKTIVGFGYNPGNSITLWFEDGSWIKTQLFSSTWPNWQSVLNKGDANRCVAIPDELFTAVERVLPFSDNGVVYFNGDTLTSHSTSGQGASYELNSPAGFAYAGARLKFLKGIASVIEFSAEHRAAFFFANAPPIRGALSQMIGSIRPTEADSEQPTPAEFKPPVQKPPQEAAGVPLPDTASVPTPAEWLPPTGPALASADAIEATGDPADADADEWEANDPGNAWKQHTEQPAADDNPWTATSKVPFPG